MSATRKTTAAKQAATTAPAKKSAAKKTPTPIEQVLDRLSTASKDFVGEVEEQMRHLEDRVAELRERGEDTAEHWVELIESRARSIRSDLEEMARRVTAVRVGPAKKTGTKKAAAKKVAAKKVAAKKVAAKKVAAKKVAAKKVAAR